MNCCFFSFFLLVGGQEFSTGLIAAFIFLLNVTLSVLF